MINGTSMAVIRSAGSSCLVYKPVLGCIIDYDFMTKAFLHISDCSLQTIVYAISGPMLHTALPLQ